MEFTKKVLHKVKSRKKVHKKRKFYYALYQKKVIKKSKSFNKVLKKVYSIKKKYSEQCSKRYKNIKKKHRDTMQYLSIHFFMFCEEQLQDNSELSA